MTDPAIHDFHFHLYYDAEEVDHAQHIGEAVRDRFGVPMGHLHLRPVGPHPRGSCQLTIPTSRFAEVASWLMLHREGLTVFAHASTGNDLADHTDHVLWLGPSERLELGIFG
ncbi:MAG: DOPA 4,5-dioxygenase family protein [Sphingomicrobium sp.]